MRRKLLGFSALLFAAVVGMSACSEPRVAAHIESLGNTSLDSVGAGTTRTLRAMVTDQNHDGIEGVTVNWHVLLGTGTISATESTTSGDGTTSVTFTAPATSGVITTVTSGVERIGAASSHSMIVK